MCVPIRERSLEKGNQFRVQMPLRFGENMNDYSLKIN